MPPDPQTDPGTSFDLTRHRLRSHPPVPLPDLRPSRPEPPEADITAAMRDVPVALSESRFAGPAFLPVDPSDRSILYQAWLAFAREREPHAPCPGRSTVTTRYSCLSAADFERQRFT